jgi:hypothetical protein
MISKVAAIFAILAAFSSAHADELTGPSVKGNGNQVPQGDNNNLNSGMQFSLSIASGNVIVDKHNKSTAPKPADRLAEAQLALLVDKNPTEISVQQAHIGAWVGVTGPTFDVALKNVTDTTALEINIDILGPNNTVLKLKQPFSMSFRHYAIRGGMTQRLPIITIQELENFLKLHDKGRHIVAAGTNAGPMREDCRLNMQYAIGPDMPCRPLDHPISVQGMPIILRVEYRDVLKGRHQLSSAIFLYTQRLGENDVYSSNG